ncbi:MAG: hypothetical protein KDA85_04655, partial [Planctomycetaceae bacterium]|nr:hypothetical protein [Planctomycetaceae bacterium]
ACSFNDQRPELETPAPEMCDPTGDDDQPDFVAAYMEELLARSRAGAGTSLPSELKKEKETHPVKSAPKVTSFLEQYMAGNMGSLDGEPSASAANTQSVEQNSAPQRQKIDREKLRENMDSFRSLSTQSVENALASHAMRMERNGIQARYALSAVLAILAILLGAAHVTELFVQPTVAIGVTGAAVLAGLELMVKIYRVKSRFRSTMSSLTPKSAADQEKPGNSDQPVDMLDAAGPVASAATAGEHLLTSAVEPAIADQDDPADELPPLHTRTQQPLMDDSEESILPEDSQYFEV